MKRTALNATHYYNSSLAISFSLASKLTIRSQFVTAEGIPKVVNVVHKVLPSSYKRYGPADLKIHHLFFFVPPHKRRTQLQAKRNINDLKPCQMELTMRKFDSIRSAPRFAIICFATSYHDLFPAAHDHVIYDCVIT